VQVIGYKVGMLLAGGILVWATAHIGWRGAFLAMAGLAAAVLIGVLLTPESPGSESSQSARASIRAVLGALWTALRRPGGAWILVTVATYKLGESMIDAMFKPFLLDLGFTASQLGMWLGSWGMGASVLGSAAGGYLAFRWRRLSALRLTAALRVLPELAQWCLALAPSLATSEAVIAVGIAENLFGGALTTVMFASMMGWVDKRIGATHFTLLASVEVWGKAPGSWLSGVAADAWGYGVVFLSGVCLSTAFLVWVGPLARGRPVSGRWAGTG
jgi:predicted MFS family arabinose efflux permease